MNTIETFDAGRAILEEIMRPHGFTFRELASGWSSGGNFAAGEYVRDDRRLEFHFRHSLGLVSYHLGALSLTHDAYMRALLGRGGGNQYPGFSSDPLDGFRHLSHDLGRFCGDFLGGPGDEFRVCYDKALERTYVTGFRALSLD